MLYKFTTKNKFGNPRTRIVHSKPNKPFSHGKGFGDSVNVSVFRYEYKHPTLPPALFKSPNGKTYIIPTWREVIPETTLEDINWVRDKVKEDKTISKPKEWKFESKSKPGNFYIVKQISDYKVTCNCSGQYRAKDRKCVHLKTVMKELGI
jgi:hypothetical protein